MKDPNQPIPGKFFAFVTETQVTEYHTMIVEATTAEEAERKVTNQFNNHLNGLGPRPANPMTIGLDLEVRIKPMRERHWREDR